MLQFLNKLLKSIHLLKFEANFKILTLIFPNLKYECALRN